ncbi:MAG TPA: nickel pincer cofactor biosynthesis protein LarC [Nitrososphaeraceae archaeon]|nr:nickel pincer cofactor biosynthesis protein LarC [Nitrososphaeraceae archaeon]
MTQIAIIDSQVSGISGDMLLSSLVDVGADKRKIINAIWDCQNFLDGTRLLEADFLGAFSHGFRTTIFRLKYKDNTCQRKGIEMYRSLASCCNSLDLEQRAKTFALESLKTLVMAEAVIHGKDFSSVHLHESSSIDTFADLVGCATALQDLKLFQSKILSTKIAIGGGVVKFSHGTISNPTNAILEIFKNKRFSLIGGQVDQEITTPTGAAMLVNLASESINLYPSFIPEKIGYGSGHKKFKEIPNFLKIVIGKSSFLSEVSTDTIYLMETNIDDVSGELIGNLIDQLTQAKARDVIAIPGMSKKSRPAYVIRVISDQTHKDNILEIIFRESGTMGVRIQEVQRIIASRTIVIVPVKLNNNNNHFNIHVKIAKDSNGKTISIKPEFDDIKNIASKAGIPVKNAMELANIQIMERIGSG